MKEPRQRVINIDYKVTVDGYFVWDTPSGRHMLELATADDLANGFIPGATQDDYYRICGARKTSFGYILVIEDSNV
jgi:hypothetical protein